MMTMRHGEATAPEDWWRRDPGNGADAFTRMRPAAQAALRMWVRLALEPTHSIREADAGNYSYRLKHDAERALGWYVSNGEVKGAMLAEGYAWRNSDPAGRPDDPDSLNWTFNSRPRCPHRMGRMVVGLRVDQWGDTHPCVEEWAFTCPLATRYNGHYAEHDCGGFPYTTIKYPALCQATDAELAAFDALRAKAGAK